MVNHRIQSLISSLFWLSDQNLSPSHKSADMFFAEGDDGSKVLDLQHILFTYPFNRPSMSMDFSLQFATMFCDIVALKHKDKPWVVRESILAKVRFNRFLYGKCAEASTLYQEAVKLTDQEQYPNNDAQTLFELAENSVFLGEYQKTHSLMVELSNKSNLELTRIDAEIDLHREVHQITNGILADMLLRVDYYDAVWSEYGEGNIWFNHYCLLNGILPVRNMSGHNREFSEIIMNWQRFVVSQVGLGNIETMSAEKLIDRKVLIAGEEFYFTDFESINGFLDSLDSSKRLFVGDLQGSEQRVPICEFLYGDALSDTEAEDSYGEIETEVQNMLRIDMLRMEAITENPRLHFICTDLASPIFTQEIKSFHSARRNGKWKIGYRHDIRYLGSDSLKALKYFFEMRGGFRLDEGFF